MFIGGLQKFSLLDYPNKISAIIFTQGCNFRCQYCYNPMLVCLNFSRGGKIENNFSHFCEEKKDYPLINEDSLFCFLKKRKNKLDAVVITGGEPSLHKDLPEFIKKIKKIGYLVKLDTNGSNPEMIEKIIKLKLVDYFAMDLKGPFEKYNKIIGAKVDFKKIKKSAKIIMTSGIDYEFRTTIVPSLLNKADIKKMGKIIFGAEKWFLQKFKIKAELINEDFKKEREPSEKEMKELKEVGKKFVKICEIR